MSIRLLAFTDRGFALAERLAEGLSGEAARCGAPLSLAAWTADAFSSSEALIFVGAAGIAVRAIAPHVKSKAADPAVVVVDEGGKFAVPVLSGHLGGANDLARRIAALIEAVPVITTATDVNGVFAVDEWAKRQGCAVLNPGRIKVISSAVLAGKTIRIESGWPVAGTPPRGVVLTGSEGDVRLSLDGQGENALQLVPRIAVLGVGCRKDIQPEALEQMLSRLLQSCGVCERAVSGVASIDLKAKEPGLLAFCQQHGWQLTTFSAEELKRVPGEFSASSFVKSVTGVDNVCERSAVLASGGKLIQTKLAGNGVTMALAVRPFAPDWRWQDE